jgi:hypothetical protein
VNNNAGRLDAPQITKGDMTNEAFIRHVEAELLHGRLSMGQAVTLLRTEIATLNRSQFARMCKVSARMIAYIENDEGNQTVKSLNAVFRPFGLELCPVRIKRAE